MIKVLKLGHGDFKETFCKGCGSELAYQEWDIEYQWTSNWRFEFIKCPVCYSKVLINKKEFNREVGKYC